MLQTPFIRQVTTKKIERMKRNKLNPQNDATLELKYLA